MPKKIFIDCGGHDGCSVRFFRKNYDKNEEFDIISLEPNPNFSKCYDDFKKHEFYEAAAWIKDEELSLYLGKSRYTGSSSVIKDKDDFKINKNNPLTVKAVSLERLLREKTSEDDLIFLKMDIEGAEYEVLESLFETGLIRRIDRLFIEWHSTKLKKRKEYTTREKDLKRKLKQINLTPELWNAFGY